MSAPEAPPSRLTDMARSPVQGGLDMNSFPLHPGMGEPACPAPHNGRNIGHVVGSALQVCVCGGGEQSLFPSSILVCRAVSVNCNGMPQGQGRLRTTPTPFNVARAKTHTLLLNGTMLVMTSGTCPDSPVLWCSQYALGPTRLSAAFSTTSISGSHRQPWVHAKRKPPQSPMPQAPFPHQQRALWNLESQNPTNTMVGWGWTLSLPRRVSFRNSAQSAALASQNPKVTYYLPRRSPATYPPGPHRTSRPHCTPHPHMRKHTHGALRGPWNQWCGCSQCLQPRATSAESLRLFPPTRPLSGLSFVSVCSFPGVRPSRAHTARTPAFTSLCACVRAAVGAGFPSLCASTLRGCCVLSPTPSRVYAWGSVGRTLCVHIQHNMTLYYLSWKGAEIELIVKQESGEVEYCICNNRVLCIHKTRRSLYIDINRYINKRDIRISLECRRAHPLNVLPCTVWSPRGWPSPPGHCVGGL